MTPHPAGLHRMRTRRNAPLTLGQTSAVPSTSEPNPAPANVFKHSGNAQRAPDVRAAATTPPQRAVATKLLRKRFSKRARGAKVEQDGMRVAANAEIQWTLRSASHDFASAQRCQAISAKCAKLGVSKRLKAATPPPAREPYHAARQIATNRVFSVTLAHTAQLLTTPAKTKGQTYRATVECRNQCRVAARRGDRRNDFLCVGC